jgi:hypothetical protein
MSETVKQANAARAAANEAGKAAKDADTELRAAREAYFSALQGAKGVTNAEVTNAGKQMEKASTAAETAAVAAATAEDVAQLLDTRVLKHRTLLAQSIANEARLATELQRIDEESQQFADDTADVYDEIEKEAAKKTREDEGRDALCGVSGSESRKACFYFGVFTAALSRVVVNGEDGTSSANSYWGGKSARQIGAVAVPNAGLRWLPLWTFVSVDFGVYSAFVSPKLEAAQSTSIQGAKGGPCSLRAEDFERDLPCQGNATLTPYAAAYLGITLGRKNLGYATLMPLTLGLGTLDDAKSLKTFFGWTLGVLQLNGTLP